MSLRRIAIAALVGAAATVLAGCAAAPSAPSESRSSSPSASSSAGALTEPKSLLPGTCDELVPDPSAVVGVTVAPIEIHSNGALQRQRGDLSCTWQTSAGYEGSYVTLEIRRHAGVLAADPLGWWTPSGDAVSIGADSAGLTCNDNGAGGNCELSAISGDYWFSMSVVTPSGTLAADRGAAMTTAASDLVDQLGSEPVPADWQRPSGAWPDIDCDAVGRKADVATAVGIPAARLDDTTRQGEGFEFSEAVARLGGASSCAWSDPRDTGATFGVVQASIVAGAGWALRTVPTGSEAIDIPGADLAVIACSDSGRCSVTARIGVNDVGISDPSVSPTDLAPTREQIIATAKVVVPALRSIYH